MNGVRNPVYVRNLRSNVQQYPPPPQEVFSQVVHVDSGERWTDAHTDANDFKLRLRDPPGEVVSVELLDVMIPIGNVPSPPYLWIVIDGCETMDMMTSTQTDTAGVQTNPTATKAFAKIYVDVAANSTLVWRRGHVRHVKRFRGSQAKSFNGHVAHFQLLNPDGTVYTLPGDWSLTLEIAGRPRAAN